MSTPARSGYRFADNATGNQSNEYGNHILKRGAGEIRKPSWNRTETVVRFLPQWNFEANEWEPFRRSPAPLDFGDWIRRYDAVRGFGESGITMLLYDPIANPAYDPQSNPCNILYRAINAAIDNKTCEPDWPALLKGGQGRKAALSRSGPIYVTRCGIFRIKSKDMATQERSPLGLATSDPAFFLELPKTAGEKLISLLETPAEDAAGNPYSGDPDSPEAWKYGDIVSLDQGAYVHIYEEGSDPRAAQAAAQAGSTPRQLTVGTGGRGNYGGGGNKGGSGFTGFDLHVASTWNGYGAALNTPELEKLIKSKQKPWEECLQFYSHQEQAFLAQDGFPPNAILYAWRDHPEWIKDETRSKAVNRTSVLMGGPASQAPGQGFPANFNAGARGPVVQPPAAAGAGRVPATEGRTAQGSSGTSSSSVENGSGERSVATTGNAAGVAGTVPGGQAGPAGQNTKASSAPVGGWGSGAWDPNTGKEGNPDTVVPTALPDQTGPATVPPVTTASDREAKATAALAAARARAQRV